MSYETDAIADGMSQLFISTSIRQGYYDSVKTLIKVPEQWMVDTAVINNNGIVFDVLIYVLELCKSHHVELDFSKLIEFACYLNNIECIKILVTYGASLDDCIPKITYNYELQHSNRLIKYLLSTIPTKVIQNKALIDYICEFCYFDIALLLYDNGSDINMFTRECKTFLEEFEQDRLQAQIKISRWWIPICYRLKNEKGEYRMAVRGWNKMKDI